MPFQRGNMLLVHGSRYKTLTFTTTLSLLTPLVAVIRLLISLILLSVLESNFVGLPCFPKGMTALKGGRLITKEGDTAFFPFEIHERSSDEDPVEDVGKDSAQGGRIVYKKLKKDGMWLVICMYGDIRRDEKDNLLQPKMALKICQPPLVVAEPGYIKQLAHTPKMRKSLIFWNGSTSSTHLWVSILQMPDIPCNLERTRSISSLRHVSTYTFTEMIVLEEADTFGHETGSNQAEERGGTDEEPMKGGGRAGAVDKIAF